MERKSLFVSVIRLNIVKRWLIVRLLEKGLVLGLLVKGLVLSLLVKGLVMLRLVEVLGTHSNGALVAGIK